MEFWEQTYRLLSENRKVVLLYVLESRGSSPGRQGFRMIVGQGEEMYGSIGGGIMEHKLVELSRSLLQEGKPSCDPFIKHQVHRPDAQDRSGMICSGDQTIAFYYLQEEDLSWLQELLECLKNNEKGVLKLTDKGIAFQRKEKISGQYDYVSQPDSWTYQEQIGFTNTVYIVGGGHVGLALSRLMRSIGFYVVVIDDREGLNTLVENDYAHQTQVVSYHEIDRYIPEGHDSYVVIASFGYRTDKIVLRRLINKKFRYLGMMGSVEKVKQLYEELMVDGVTKEQLSAVHSPIGIPIRSKTPDEIAVSIAAEIIGVKNG